MKKGVFILVILFISINLSFVYAIGDLIHSWSFENNLNDSVGNANFELKNGEVEYLSELSKYTNFINI